MAHLKKLLAVMSLSLCAMPAFAIPLQQLIQHSLDSDPQILEARAHEASAESSVSAAKAAHYPVVALTGTQVLAQEHRYVSNERRRGINPGLRASVNLYSFGGIEARVNERQYNRDYYHHKIGETQEELGSTMGRLYLAALRAKEAIQAAQQNLDRHNRIVADLQIITRYDRGRQYELNQAMARRLNVEAFLANQQRELLLNLSRLAKYTPKQLTPADLEDPFIQDTATSLVQKYQHNDLAHLSSYQAQKAERNRAEAEMSVTKASRYPSIDLIATANRDNKEAYLNFSWDIFNRTSIHDVERSAHALAVAEAQLDQIARDTAERSRNATLEMQQSQMRWQIAQQQIATQKQVVKAYELQFKIARRTLIDVLDSYAELSNIEQAAIAARNDFRDAALEYLVSQAAIGRWSASK